MSQLPKLTYFDVAGRAYAVRICLFKAFGKAGWVDDRFQFAQWTEIKPKTPLGAVPVLTLPDGREVTQSEALARWAAREGGLYPTDSTDALFVDEICATAMEALNKSPQASDAAEKKRLREEYAEGFLAKAFGLLEKRLDGREYFVGGKLSLADLIVYSLTDMIVVGQFDYVTTAFLEPFPNVKAHADRVKAHELLVAYHANYPN